MHSTRTASPANTPGRGVSPPDYVRRNVAAALGFVAMTLAGAAALHVSGQAQDAGIAEAIIVVVLVGAVGLMLRIPAQARATGLAAAGFATIGVVAGLGITIGEGHALDIAYHAAILAVLVASMIALLRVTPERR